MDKQILDLVSTMSSTFDFVKNVERVKPLSEALKIYIERLLHQTVECVVFVREYCGVGLTGMSRDDHPKPKSQKYFD